MSDADACVPKALTDFVFDLYDSVTLSQLTEEQTKFYLTDFRELSTKELTHRHWHAVSRPSLRDRIEGWQVYRELFEEILEADDPNFFLLPQWSFDILNEFVYQFQGFCQIRSAVYASARKNGLVDGAGSDKGSHSSQHSTLAENLATLQNAKDAWDAESVFSYLNRLIAMGFAKDGSTASIQPVYTYLSIFSAVGLARLECLLGDYTASLQALTPLCKHGAYVVPKDEGTSVTEVLNSVIGARLSLAYHAGVSFLMLRRYKDAIRMLGDICGYLQRGFKTGQLRKLPGADQLNKQSDRMLSLLAILTHVCPTEGVLEESVLRALREKHGSKVAELVPTKSGFSRPSLFRLIPCSSTVLCTGIRCNFFSKAPCRTSLTGPCDHISSFTQVYR